MSFMDQYLFFWCSCLISSNCNIDTFLKKQHFGSVQLASELTTMNFHKSQFTEALEKSTVILSEVLTLSQFLN